NLGAQNATLLYAGTNNGADNFSGNNVGDSAVHTIKAEADNTVIGLNGGFNNGVDKIDGGGFANVTVVGTGTHDVLNFKDVEINGIDEIDGGNNHDTITTADNSAAHYRRGHGTAAFNLGAQNATLLYA